MRLIAIFFVIFAATAFAQWQVVMLNRVTLEGTFKEGGSFEVRIESDTPREASGELFGTTDAPKSVVSEIIVKTHGGRIAFPKQAFADLANPLLQTTSITGQGSSNLCCVSPAAKARGITKWNISSKEIDWLNAT